jgi:hypothetical protein
MASSSIFVADFAPEGKTTGAGVSGALVGIAGPLVGALFWGAVPMASTD